MSAPPTRPTQPRSYPRPRHAAGLALRVWQGEAPLLGLALLPAELAFRVVQALYHGAYDARLLRALHPGVPTISVGNLAVGGAGKTPVARWLVDELLRRGEAPALLHSGYAPDEPALHALWHPEVPVYAARDRRLAAVQAVAGGATVLVLDDGFQHRRLARDLDIVLVAAERWRAHPRLLPRGPWREPPAALRRAHVVMVTRKTASAEAAEGVRRALARLAPQAVLARLALLAAGWRRWAAPVLAPIVGDDAADAGQGATARAADGAAAAGGVPAGPEAPEGPLVCGISDPDLFLANAAATGTRVSTTLVFPDHHPYGREDLALIRRVAGPGGAVLTTAKDAVKLAPAAPDLDLWVLEQVPRLEAGAAELAGVLDRVLRPARRP